MNTNTGYSKQKLDGSYALLANGGQSKFLQGLEVHSNPGYIIITTSDGSTPIFFSPEIEYNLSQEDADIPITIRKSGNDGFDSGLWPQFLYTSNVSVNPNSGTVTANGFFVSSDANLKENIKKISDSIYEFNFKGSDKKSYGFIAQELEKNHPELIKEDEYKRVDYNAALALTVANLENKVKELETRIEKLEQKWDT